MKKMITIALAAMVAAGAMAQPSNDDTKTQDNMKQETAFGKVCSFFERSYKAIENSVVSGYKATETFFVGSYKTVEDFFVDKFFAEDPRVAAAQEVKAEENAEEIVNE